MADRQLTRIGVFYDGSYFAHVSDYYLHHHERHARISIHGLHAFIREEVGKLEQAHPRYCRIVEAHYFRGRFSADDARRHDGQRSDGDSTLYRERKFEDALIKAGVKPHFLPIFSSSDGRPPREKGIDVWLALEAFDLARAKDINVVVLVSGDGDYVPLVRKLNGLGARVMAVAWDFATERVGTKRVAQSLIDEVTYPLMMNSIIDDRARRNDKVVENLFISRTPNAGAQQPLPLDSTVEERNRGTGGPRVSNRSGGLGDAKVEEGRRAPNRFGSSDGDAPAEDSPRVQGWVANLPYGREFGFIEPMHGGERLFFHQSWVVGCSFNELQQGDEVRYTLDANPRDGRPVAKRVTRCALGVDGEPVGDEEEGELELK